MSTTKVKALRDVLTDRDPFCRGICRVPEHHLLFYYRHQTVFSQIDFARSTAEELETFSQACQPASFGLKNKDVLDETYRKAGKMDLDSFATLFDPRNLGIHDVIEHDLLASDQAVEFELSKLNVYGQGGFFKSHQDTPHADSMFGSLVVTLPVPHEGGHLALRLSGQEWIIDFTEQFATAANPSICFVAFFSDVEHEILPVTSGYRVTLTYNLHFRSQKNVPRVLSGPFHDKLKQKLIDLINDIETLPNGGYLGFGLCHQYAYDQKKPIDVLADKLKGSDAALANVCKELGLPYSLRLLYAQEADFIWPEFNLLSRVKLNGPAPPASYRMDWTPLTRPGSSAGYDDDNLDSLLRDTVYDISPEDMEGVEIIGRQLDRRSGLDLMGERGRYNFMKKYYNDPVRQVLEVKEMSSILCETAYACHGNYVFMDRFYATGCMVISVEPSESRERIPVVGGHHGGPNVCV